MPTGLHNYISRARLLPQNDVSPAPTTMERRKVVAANAKMPPPPSKAQANTQAKLNSLPVKLSSSNNSKPSSSHDLKFDINDYPPSSQKNVSSIAMPSIPGFMTALELQKQAFHPAIHSNGNPGDERQTRGIFDESTYDEDSDDTTRGDFAIGDIFNGTEQIDQSVQPTQHTGKAANGRSNDDSGDSEIRNRYQQFAGQTGPKIGSFRQIHEVHFQDSEQVFRGLTDDEIASWSEDEEDNDPAALNPAKLPRSRKGGDRTGRFNPVVSGSGPSIRGTGEPEAPFQQILGESGVPGDEEASEDGIDDDMDHDAAQKPHNGTSHLYGMENHVDTNEIDMLDRNSLLDGSDIGDIESDQESPTPTPSVPKSRVAQPQSVGTTRSRKRVTSELDYDMKALDSMTYAELHNQPFEENPNHQTARLLLPVEQANGRMEDHLKHFADKERKDQESFFHQMSLDEWESAGDWFLDQFASILSEVKDARNARREQVKNLEDELAERMATVKDKSDGLDNVLEKMRAGGREVLLGRIP